MSTDAMLEEDASLSALDANIKERGHNSYYYAHSLRINGPKWDGKEEPRLLGTDHTASAKTSVKNVVSAFNSYSWVDDGKNMKIYIDHDEADKVESTNISIESSSRSLTFIVRLGSNKHLQLQIDDLDGEIVSASYKAKAARFILTLKKADEDETWSKLKKSS